MRDSQRTRHAKSHLGHAFERVVKARFPKADYYAVMGELAEKFGGTSQVLIHRSNLIAEHLQQPFTILTFGHLRDYRQLTTEMQEAGSLSRLVSFRNMWDEFAEIEDAPPKQLTLSREFVPLSADSASEVVTGDGVPWRYVRSDESGNTLQIDYLRDDLTVIVSDVRASGESGAKRDRILTLCNAQGAPIREFKSLHQLRLHWLDRVIGSRNSIVFSDSFRIAKTMHAYRRQNVAVVQSFHNNHIVKEQREAFGITSRDYLDFLRNIDSFDASVFLTNWQLEDVNALLGAGPRRWVVPNSRPTHLAGSEDSPLRNQGITVGRLVGGKQFDHAIRAVGLVNRNSGSRIEFGLFGDGPDRERLEAVAEELAGPNVRFYGHSNAVRDAFDRSAFSILPSRSEAFPLVVMESLAHGCIPISYDVRYGPRDLIDHEVDGFLVKPGDIEGIADSIERIQKMSDSEFAKMRSRAIKKAQKLSDTAALRRWSRLLRETTKQKSAPEKLSISNVAPEFDFGSNSLTINVTFNTNRELRDPYVFLTLLGRNTPLIMRTGSEVSIHGDLEYKAIAKVSADLVSNAGNAVLDAYLDVFDRAGSSKMRLKAEGTSIGIGDWVAYSTTYGNLSFRPSADG